MDLFICLVKLNRTKSFNLLSHPFHLLRNTNISLSNNYHYQGTGTSDFETLMARLVLNGIWGMANLLHNADITTARHLFDCLTRPMDEQGTGKIWLDLCQLATSMLGWPGYTTDSLMSNEVDGFSRPVE